MRNFINFIRQPWLLALLGILLFSMITWFIGPLIAIAEMQPLSSAGVRSAVIMTALILWGLNNLRIQRQIHQANQALSAGLQADAQSKPATDIPNPDEKILTKRLQDSLALLKGSRFEREGKLYKLPWYMIIGAPGSGKTTAIQQSGLQFPLQEQLGNEPVRGEGGTRYCDWWFTDDAILIDTAGRYTTQDNPKKIEASAWNGFLARLKKARPKRPLNGIIVTISIHDVITKTDTQKSLQVSAIKQRIQELNNHLKMQLPVYVLFTKMDMVAGFNSFFSYMEKETRQQIWGFSVSNKHHTPDNLTNWFNTEYDILISNLNGRINHRLSHEASQQRRTMIYEFPRQMHALQNRLNEFITPIFSSNQFESPLHLRGVFFLSSTQMGQASQWVTGLVPPEQCAPPADAIGKEPRTYFVHRLFKHFIFAEANIASLNHNVKQRFKMAYLSLLALSTVSFAGMLFAWSHSKSLNEQYLVQLEQHITDYREQTQGGLDQQHSWQTLAKGLDLLRALPTGFDENDSAYHFKQGFGLYQGDKIGAQAKATYLDGLGSFFMADLDLLLTDQIQSSLDDDERLYESLKYYLMLYYPSHMDTKSFSLWVNVLWQRQFPGEQQATLREHLNTHLQTVLEQHITPRPIHQNVVTKAQDTLIKTPLDLRAYRRIKNDYLDTHRNQFSLTGVLGKKAELIFYRRSGKAVTEGVPSFFTFEGFHTGFNVENLKLSQQLTDEQWIYGDNLLTPLTDDDIANIRTRVKAHYFDEYQIRWSQYLNDIALQPFGTINRGKAVVQLLAGADEPLIAVLKHIRKNTALADIPGIDEDTKAVLNNLAEDIASTQKGRLERLVPTGIIAKNASLPGQEVSDYFSDLNEYVNSTNGLPLFNLQQAIHGLNNYLQSLSYAEDVSQAAFASTSGDTQRQALQTLKIAIDDAPSSIQQWFDSLSRNTENVAIIASKNHMNNAWRNDVLEFYNNHLKDKYPLNKTSMQDIKLADFATFFAPEGLLDTYFTQYVLPFVDTSTKPWRWKKSAGMSSQSLAFFQQASTIRDAYFGSSKSLTVDFSLKPYTLDKTASGMLIDTAGVSLNYFHGPVRGTTFNWPGENPTFSKVAFNLASKGTPISIRTEGEWSWFRLLDQYATTIPNPNNDGLLVTFTVDGISSTQELQPLTSRNPFENNLLQNFSLPVRL